MSTNAPPCATCGQPLRWIAESYGWGCDRCRQFHPAGQAAAATPSAQQPAQQPVAPQTAPGAYGQQYTATAAAAPAGGKSNKGLFIALGGVAVVGGIIAIVLLTRGGGGGGGGSRDGTIKKVFSGLSSGDVDGLIALAPDSSMIEKFEDCDKDAKKKRSSDDDDDEDDPAKRKKDMEKKIRKEVEKLVKKAKKAKFEIEEIVTKEPKAMTAEDRECDDKDDEDSEGRRKKKRDKDKDDEDDDAKVLVVARKGCKTRKGCKANYDIRMQRVDVKVKITPDKEGAKAKTKKVGVNLMEIDGGWYVEDVKLPDMGGGDDEDSGESGGGGDDDDGDNSAVFKGLARYTDQVCACKDMDCVTKAGEEWAKKAAELAKTAGKGKPSQADMKKAEELTKKLTDCTKKITDEMMKKAEPPKAPDEPKPPDDDDASGGSVPSGVLPSGVVLSDPPSDMPATCKLYRTAVEKAMKCPEAKIDAKMKSLFADGWNQFVKSWGMMTTGSMKSSVGSTCDKMVEAMNRTVDSMCR